MKKVFSLIAGLALVLGVGTSLEAQRNLRFTVGAGLSLPRLSMASHSVIMTTTPYVYAGLDYALPRNNRVHIEGGLEWKRLGIKGQNDQESYFSVPISVRYQISEYFPLSLGIGAYLGKTVVSEDDLDHGAIFKAHYDFSKSVFATMQYNLGLREHGYRPAASINAFQIGLGISF